MNEKISILLILLVQHFGINKTQEILSREKRFLIVPPTSPTRHQLISGIGIPLNLENESITLGLVLKAQYFLPENVDQLKPIYFPGIFGNFTPVNFAETQWHEFPLGRRKREVQEIVTDKYTGQRYEQYVGDFQQVGNEPLDEFTEDEKVLTRETFEKASEEQLADTSGSRWLMYDGLANLLNSKGLDGRPCVLRGICEAAETKFSYHSGVFGELLHLIFTPSSSFDKIVNPDHYDYVKAELLGASGEPCAEIFHKCKNSLMEIFTQVQDSQLYKFD